MKGDTYIYDGHLYLTGDIRKGTFNTTSGAWTEQKNLNSYFLHSFATSIKFQFDGRMEGDRSFKIKQMGRNHGHSCPKERHGQKKPEIT
jgi:hypothetical protein